jgi:hypothetical protein
MQRTFGQPAPRIDPDASSQVPERGVLLRTLVNALARQAAREHFAALMGEQARGAPEACGISNAAGGSDVVP